MRLKSVWTRVREGESEREKDNGRGFLIRAKHADTELTYIICLSVMRLKSVWTRVREGESEREKDNGRGFLIRAKHADTELTYGFLMCSSTPPLHLSLPLLHCLSPLWKYLFL